MKLGILTFHNGLNYGAVLQAYSLKEYLSMELKVPVSIINYRSKEIDKQFEYTKFSTCGSIKKWIAHNATYFLINHKKIRAFRTFDKHLSLTKTVTSEEVINNILGFTHIIVGSDQVWNQYSANDDTYFLPGMDDDVTKIGYAISVGNSNNISEYSSLRSESIYRFDALSFREKTALNVFADRYAIKCKQVIDPTLLLNADFWQKKTTRRSKENYVFLYNLRKSKTLVKAALEMAKRKNAHLYTCNASFDGAINTFLKAKSKSCVDPLEFIELIMNAQFVITDSFHGVALSILLHKEFAVELNKNKYNTNERILDLLDELGLLDRIIEEGKEFWNTTPIEYNKVEALLEKKREIARDFIIGVL